MRALSASELLAVWERGQGQSLSQKAITLLTHACDDTPVDQIAQWSLGARDARLLTLRECLFGSRLQSVADCPACREKLEMEFATSDVRVPRDDSPLASNQNETISVNGHDIVFRLPNSTDLDGLVATDDAAANHLRLLRRCILTAHYGKEVVPLEQLPPPVISALAQAMGERDAQADVQLALSCPACHHQWNGTFDIVSFLWTEIHTWAMRVLREVHLLASAYGWTEEEVLAVSPWRRQVYLQMAGA